jgi:metal-sulfur cluster biosynthetic enzyme
MTSSSTTQAMRPFADYPHDEIWDVLRAVEDPEMGISIVDLGLVVSAERAGSHVAVCITYTAMGCPATELIEGDIAARLRALPGVGEVDLEVVWDPVWTNARLTEDACDALRTLGVAV